MSRREFWLSIALIAAAGLYLAGHVVHAVIWGAWS